MTDQPIDLSALATERRNPASADLDLLDTSDILRVINEQDRLVAEAVALEIPRITAAVDAIVAAIRAGGRLIYIGAGTSGRLGVLDASECPPTFNTDPGLVVGLIAGGDRALRHPVEHVEDRPEAGANALEDVALAASDVVVGIAASGRTPYVLGAMAYANSVGATTVGLCNSPDSALSRVVKLCIVPVVGPEVVTGSTRMKAGTAQKLVLNMLTTATMVKLGKTYGNLMVDVQSTNAKLRERAVGIVRDAADVSDAAARSALDVAGGEVKTAIVASKLQIPAPDARDRLAAAGGVVRAALAEGRQ
ncbi:MAG: N-acetylmuramic acid 6-phosphate etherase [Chloroflexota bacterium]|nr:N-acetylmuramic acid 6-phosphate etherase [Chloroflexota bacterium]